MASAPKAGSRPNLSLEVRRTFAAPVETVFAAWADPEQLKQWMCGEKPGAIVIQHRQEIRTGGSWLTEYRESAGGLAKWGQGTYLEVTPNRKIVFTWHWTDATLDGVNLHPDSPDTQVTVDFFARGNATEVVLTHAIFHSEKDYKDHNRGWEGCLDLLAKLLQVTSTRS
jgi:uncharacterized protein YndB with AHSA1/START domain